jgi:hypothetical protein
MVTKGQDSAKSRRFPPEVLFVALVFLALSGCSKAPEASTPLIPVMQHDQAVLTVEKIKQDLVRRRVHISGVTEDLPDDVWMFDFDEPKQVEILQQQATDRGLTVVILMRTGDNPNRNEEEPIEVSGKLRLDYLKQGSRLMLKDVENLTFRYSIGIAV